MNFEPAEVAADLRAMKYTESMSTKGSRSHPCDIGVSRLGTD